MTRTTLLLLVLSSWACVCVVIVEAFSSSASSTSLPASRRSNYSYEPCQTSEVDHDDGSWKKRVTEAMNLSQLAAENVTAAEEAASLWQKLLRVPPTTTTDLTPSVVSGLCHTLYATTLVRLGRDTEALRVFDTSLSYRESLNEATRERIYLGKAGCWQRLSQYNLALQSYQQVNDSLEGAWGAFVCALRIPNITLAQEILQNAIQMYPLEVRFVEAQDVWQLMFPSWANAAMTPIQKRGWLFSRPNTNSSDDVSRIVEFNVGPFDDPLLKLLDDKVLLHELLHRHARHTTSFWPTSFIWPLEKEKWSDFVLQNDHGYGSTAIWVGKTRAGYGSHGNRLQTIQELADEVSSSTSASFPTPDIVQKLIDPPLLINGRVFSLRIYVHYRIEEPPVLSEHGLVKLAALPFHNGTFEPSRRMTNSGRAVDAMQMDLSFFRNHIGSDNFDKIWLQIRQIVTTVMDIYRKDAAVMVRDQPDCQIYRRKIQQLGFRKVLGFDFMVDENCRAWLLEVNRFPGLDARDDRDGPVKRAVLMESWHLPSDAPRGMR